ncbi:MAG: magnesium transporter [Euryarchaeota archaeon]|nr:magnesium transporter [Euryarchaeota archaeon]
MAAASPKPASQRWRPRVYRKRLVRQLMTVHFPRAAATDSAQEVRRRLEGQAFDEAGHVYLVDEENRLVGQVPIEHLLKAGPNVPLRDIQGPSPVEVRVEDPAEATALVAVTRQESDVAVVDEGGRLVGVVATPVLLALLHAEHVDDYLTAAGVHGSHPDPHGKFRLLAAYRARLRWLVVGLVGGIGAAFIVRHFEATLADEVALVAFLPLVVYLGDAIGTQTEALMVRSLALGRHPFGPQLLQEGGIGALLGLSLGALASASLLATGFPRELALIVGLAILASAFIATLLATCICWGAAFLGTDPAFASGPVATVLQDVVSVTTYLLIASRLL